MPIDPTARDAPSAASAVSAASAAAPTDAELWARFAGGDRRAMSEVVRRHGAAVLRFARALVKDASLAEDVLQETFLSATRAASGYRGEGSLRGWLLTIARRAALRLRPRAAAPATSIEDCEDLAELGRAAGWGADPEELLSQEQSRELASRALDALDPEDREILILRDVEGLTGPEAAEVLDVGLPAMKSRLHRARLRFAAALRGLEDRREEA